MNLAKVSIDFLLRYEKVEYKSFGVSSISYWHGAGSDIEKAMSINEDGALYEEWLELRNGCLCCSVK